jgi:sulfite reductase (NADPH) hemoprotein beta-component
MSTGASCDLFEALDAHVIYQELPSMSKLHGQVYVFAKDVSEHLLPRTSAYHEIWLDKKMVAGDLLKDVEPMYGEFYLPRKVRYVSLDLSRGNSLSRSS